MSVKLALSVCSLTRPIHNYAASQDTCENEAEEGYNL